MTEYQLPAAQHKLAEIVRDAIPRLEPFVQGVHCAQLFAALVAEANTLNPDLEPRSVLVACMNTAIIGLIPGQSLGHCYLYPFKGRCQLIIGYQGFLELAMRNQFLSVCNAPQVVLRDEDFQMWSDEHGNHFKHSIPVERALDKPNVTGAYVTYTTQAGGSDFVFVPRSELNSIDTGRHVWKSDPIAMMKKTTIRRAAKLWRKGVDLGRAIMIDEQAERGVEQACPEFQIDMDPLADELANLQRTLDATLNSRIGCGSATERDSILQWALDTQHVTYSDVCQHEDLIRQALTHMTRYVREGAKWDEILQFASEDEQ